MARFSVVATGNCLWEGFSEPIDASSLSLSESSDSSLEIEGLLAARLPRVLAVPTATPGLEPVA